MAGPTHSKKLLLTLACICLGVAVSSCSNKPPYSEGVANSPYREYLELALSNPLSDFQRDILIDGVVTLSEVTEAQTRFKGCFEDQGYSVGIDPSNGAVTWSVRPEDDRTVVEAAYDACLDEFMTPVSALYYDMKMNPNNEDSESATVECLKRQGTVDADFTVELYRESVRDLLVEENLACMNDPWNS